MPVNNRSRWHRSARLEVYDLGGTLVRRPYLLPYKPVARTDYPDNIEHRLTRADTWSNLAFRYYGDSYLWWVICEFNNVVNPWTELEEGITLGRLLKIPTLNRVQFDLLNFRRARRNRKGF